MSREKQFEARELSAQEYVLALHAPEDQVAVLLRNRSRSQTLQRITSAETVTGTEFQRWLKRENRSGSDVFVGMNPLKEGATSRSKENIREVRHVYLDLDEDAPASLTRVHESSDVPPPNFVLDTSPAKHQVVWKIEAVDLEQAETLLRSLTSEFGGDSAATDATRVLRLASRIANTSTNPNSLFKSTRNPSAFIRFATSLYGKVLEVFPATTNRSVRRGRFRLDTEAA